MLLAAKSGDWLLLEQLESEREAVFLHLFPCTGTHASYLVEIRAMIEMVLKVDREIAAICSTEADDCHRQLAAIAQGDKAVAAYVTNSN